MVRKTACFCIFSNSVIIDITEISDIRAFKKGQAGINFNDVHNAIIVEFKEMPQKNKAGVIIDSTKKDPMVIWETKDDEDT